MKIYFNPEKRMTLWWHKSEYSNVEIKPFTTAIQLTTGVDIDGMHINGWVTEEEFTFLVLKGLA